MKLPGFEEMRAIAERSRNRRRAMSGGATTSGGAKTDAPPAVDAAAAPPGDAPPPTGAPAPVPPPPGVASPPPPSDIPAADAPEPPAPPSKAPDRAETVALPPTPPPTPPAPSGRRTPPPSILLALAGAVLALIGFGVGWLVFGGDEQTASPVGPTVVVSGGGGSGQQQTEQQGGTANDLGFPGFATANTTRVGGADPTASAAGIALASYPSQGDIGHPRMVTIVPASSWQAGIAAASLAEPAIGAPILYSGPDGVPEPTATALAELAPTGVKRADGTQLLTVGDVATPEGLQKIAVKAGDPASMADQLDRRRAQLSGVEDPDHILVVSSSAGEFAMPAAAWAARSGDPVVFADGDRVPKPTLDVLSRHKDASIYVLGPESVISKKAIKALSVNGRKPVRVGADAPVENAIEFARFADGNFGFGIADPGHGFVIANTALPGDAGAAAPLSAAGKPGPLLLTDDAAQLPKALQSFLLDTKPGYVDDPTRAIYNHVWLIGDAAAISLQFQADVDRLTELAPVSQSKAAQTTPSPTAPEPEAGG